jgi:FtsZ-interacting cell division protein YlmF
MGNFNDWLNGRGPRNFDPKRDRAPEFYEDTHDGSGAYTGHKIAAELPGPAQSVVPRQYQNVVVYDPKTSDDVQRLIDYLKRREPAIVNLDATEPEVAQRILDFVSGAIYALSGSVHRIASNIFLLSPEGVEITIPYELD